MIVEQIFILTKLNNLQYNMVGSNKVVRFTKIIKISVIISNNMFTQNSLGIQMFLGSIATKDSIMDSP